MSSPASATEVKKLWWQVGNVGAQSPNFRPPIPNIGVCASLATPMYMYIQGEAGLLKSVLCDGPKGNAGPARMARVKPDADHGDTRGKRADGRLLPMALSRPGRKKSVAQKEEGGFLLDCSSAMGVLHRRDGYGRRPV
jgi:hypothetical protein